MYHPVRVVILFFVGFSWGLSDKDSELLHKLNEGITVNGLALFQGDIVHDAVINTVFNSRQRRGLARQSYRLWDNNIVPYLLDTNIGLRKLHALESAMRSWEAKTCIRFKRKLWSDTNYVRFTSGKGCFATIGKGVGEQLLSLGKGCGTPGFALHELAHVIGFFHEQSRPDRDDYVDVLWEHIREDKKEQFTKYTSVDIDPRGIPYDYLSITHYGPYDFRSEPGLATLQVKKLPENPADMGQRRYLSSYDVIGANVLYQCTQHLEEQCEFGTRYIDTDVREMKHYACKENGNDWGMCSMPIIKTRKIMVCNWNRTQFEIGRKKIEPTDSWQDNKIGPDPTSTTGMCIQRVPYDKEIEIPCGENTCKKVVTMYRNEAGPCWGAMDDPGLVTDVATWTEWSPWSPCNRDCARGIQLRVRICTNERDGSKSNKCPGYRHSVRMCCNGPCYKEILLSPASPYGTSKTLKVVSKQCPPALRQDRTKLYSDNSDEEL